MIEWFDLKAGDYIKVVFPARKLSVVCRVKKVYSDYAIAIDPDLNFCWLFASGVGSYFAGANPFMAATNYAKATADAIERKKYRLFRSTESQFNIGVI